MKIGPTLFALAGVATLLWNGYILSSGGSTFVVVTAYLTTVLWAALFVVAYNRSYSR